MIMENGWSKLADQVIGAMVSGETTHATAVTRRLGAAVGNYAAGQDKSLSSVWEPFLRLLSRRGYFVADLEETRDSLQQILEMGPGFDLYDLAAALAGCDVILATHLNAPSSRVFPELRPFTPAADARGGVPVP